MLRSIIEYNTGPSIRPTNSTTSCNAAKETPIKTLSYFKFRTFWAGLKVGLPGRVEGSHTFQKPRKADHGTSYQQLSGVAGFLSTDFHAAQFSDLSDLDDRLDCVRATSLCHGTHLWRRSGRRRPLVAISSLLQSLRLDSR